jgi:glucan phosphoethanolaminetransferase (alkaline phosphatase superfamily)
MYLCNTNKKIMKKLTIISLLLSMVTIGVLYFFNIIEITEKNWPFLPLLYGSLCLLYWWFGGLIGIWFFDFDFDPRPVEKSSKEDDNYYSSTIYSIYNKKEKKSKKSKNKKDFTKSFAIGYLTDNPLLGGVLGGDMAGGLLGSSLDGDLFN